MKRSELVKIGKAVMEIIGEVVSEPLDVTLPTDEIEEWLVAAYDLMTPDEVEALPEKIKASFLELVEVETEAEEEAEAEAEAEEEEPKPESKAKGKKAKKEEPKAAPKAKAKKEEAKAEKAPKEPKAPKAEKNRSMAIGMAMKELLETTKELDMTELVELADEKYRQMGGTSNLVESKNMCRFAYKFALGLGILDRN